MLQLLSQRAVGGEVRALTVHGAGAARDAASIDRLTRELESARAEVAALKPLLARVEARVESQARIHQLQLTLINYKLADEMHFSDRTVVWQLPGGALDAIGVLTCTLRCMMQQHTRRGLPIPSGLSFEERVRLFIPPTAEREKDALDPSLFLYLRGVARDNKADEEEVVSAARDLLATLTREALACQECDDDTRPSFISVVSVAHYISVPAFLALAAIIRFTGRRLLSYDVCARLDH